MTVPLGYAHASEQFDAFMEALRVRYDHVTTHQTYQTVEAVFRVFRRRLTADQVLMFADTLPAVLRAVFVADWRPGEVQASFGERAVLTAEVLAYRGRHNFSPDTAIADMADILRRFVDRSAFETILAALPDGAAAFWALPG
ncbi:MAG: DUF2267 domain-containing protein [Bauldia sp.]